MTESAFEVVEVAVGPGGSRVRVAGRLTWTESVRLRDELARVVRAPSSTVIDVSAIEFLDATAAAVLAQARLDALRQGAAISFQGASGAVSSDLGLFTDRDARECLLPPPRHEGLLTQIGRESVRLARSLREILVFTGEAAEALVATVKRPATMNWRDVPRMIERHGADGIPISLTIAVLIGLITAYQAAIQLRQFGADSLVADLVSLSLTRELAPLMTAIVVAGRSGAAIAAELGTMRVSEEVDALRTLGFCPQRWLVFPRVLAVALVAPVLTLMADVVGIAGGFFVAISQLEVGPRGYLFSVTRALDASDVLGGLLKAFVFGGNVALTACQRGLATEGGAEGVGRSTTSAVVTTLFTLVLVDAMFSVLFDLYGL